MNIGREQTIKKHLEVLKELKLALKYQPKINMSGFMKDKKVSKNGAVALIHGKVVENKGGKGATRYYVWNTIEPNLKMAEEWINRMQENSNKSRDKNVRSKKLLKQKRYDNIIRLRRLGKTYGEIEKEVGFCQATISKVCNSVIKDNDSISYKNISNKQIGNKNAEKIHIPNYENTPRINNKMELSKKQNVVSILWGLITIKYNK